MSSFNLLPFMYRKEAFGNKDFIKLTFLISQPTVVFMVKMNIPSTTWFALATVSLKWIIINRSRSLITLLLSELSCRNHKSVQLRSRIAIGSSFGYWEHCSRNHVEKPWMCISLSADDLHSPRILLSMAEAERWTTASESLIDLDFNFLNIQNRPIITHIQMTSRI